MRASHVIAAALTLLPGIASATETTTYTYDAKGRLVQVGHAGSINDGLATSYTYDAADNRSNVTTINATAQVIVVPLGGLRVIPIN